MANQIPIKVMCDGSGNTCGLAQFTSSDSVAIAAGGTGLTSQGICEFVQPGLYAVGCQVTYLGICAGKADTGAGHDNTYVGYAAGTAVTTGCQHTLIGKGSGIAITTCSGTVAVGYNTANALTFGMHNTYVGNYAGASGSIPNNNTFIGFRSGVSNGCNNNTGVGTCSLAANDRGEDNVAIGANAGATQLHQGCDNVFVGSNAGAVSLCSHNVSIGSYAGKAATTGTGNVMIGACVGYGVVGGASNVYIGDKAGLANTSGNANVFIGNCAGCATTGSCCLIIGNGACDLITGNFNTGIVSLDCVGIGTASPAKLLDITGDNNSARVGQVINQNGTHDAELQMHVVGGSGGGNYSMHVGGANGSIAGDWGLYDNDAAAYRMVVLSDGKIGIGSTSADYPLSLYSSTAGTALVSYIRHTDNSNAASHAELYLSTGGASGGDPVVHYNNSVLNWYAGIDNSDSDKFKISPTQFGCEFVITCTGLVGIGASTPNVPLTINQTSDGAGIAIEYNTGANENAPRFNFVKSRGSTEGSTTIVADGDELGRLNWQGADGSGTVNAAYIRGFVDGTPGTNDMPGRLSFWTTADGANSPTERMTIKSDGSIGIATATPGPGLVTMGGGVAGTTVRIDIDGGSDNGKGAQLAFQSGGADKFYIGDTASLQGGSESSRDMSIYTTSGLGIRFYTGGNNRRMDITSDGDLQMAAGSDIIQESGNDMNFKVSVNRDIIFSDTAEIARFTGANGRLGIGTTSPSELLHLAASTGLSIALQSTHTNIQNTFDITVSDPSGQAGTTAGSGIAFSSNEVDRGFFFRQDGYVGIGTTAPDTLLHLESSGFATANLQIESTHASCGYPTITFKNDATSWTVYAPNGGSTTSADAFQIQNAAGANFLITTDGNVGINNSDPTGTGSVQAHDLVIGNTSLAASCHTGITLMAGTSGISRLDFGDTVNAAAGGIYYNHGSSPGDMNFVAEGAVRMSIDQNGVDIDGALSKGSGSFNIEHPLESKKETHRLVHSFTESPQADLLYSGWTKLTSGTTTINIDTLHDMTEGTFVALNRCVRVFTSNESDWDMVRGSVTGNELTIESNNASSAACVSWLVIGERCDKHMMETDWTDDNGRVIVEPLDVRSASPI